MALPAVISCLLLSFLITVTPRPGSCEQRAGTTGSLIQCYDDPVPDITNTANATEFLASLLPLLAELPSAAAPTGFASLNSNGRPFVRGLCFGDATVPSECLGCLSVAARNLKSGCGATTRRAGIWTGGCFVGYGDTHASSPAEDDFRSRVLLRGSDAVPDAHATTLYSHYLHAWLLAYMAQPVALTAVRNITAPRMVATADAAAPVGGTMRSTVHVLAQCARDRTAAECLRCLLESAKEIDWAIDADRRDGGVAAAVVGFDCYIRVNVSTALVLHPQAVTGVLFSTVIGILVVLLLVAVLAALCLCLSLPNGKKTMKKAMKRICTLQR